MTLLQAIILGLVQGLTEFLPISSSGHLVLVPALLGWDLPPAAFDVLLHTGSLVAIVAYLWRDLLALVKGAFVGGADRKLLGWLILATVPAGIVGFTLENQISRLFHEPTLVAGLLIVTGIILLGTEALFSEPAPSGDRHLAADLTAPSSISIGLAQAMAILPGISRSGTTISVGMLAGLDRERAARFSFLMIVPVLIGASIDQIPELAGSTFQPGVLVGGFLAALASSYLAVSGLMRYLANRSLRPFGMYCIVAGILAITALALID